MALLLSAALVSSAQVASREEEIRQQQVDKRARLWPEHTSGIVNQFNKYTERGLLEGSRSGKGVNGPQFVLGGMRSGNGTTVGVGYRRVDLWHERLGIRATVRGTLERAYMFDLEVNSPRWNTDRTELEFYLKYENSPLMDYYGPGANSSKADRSSYRLEDFGADIRGRYRMWNRLWGGASFGGYIPNTGPGRRDGYPTTDEKFSPAQTPGLGQQANFVRTGLLLQFDYRDLPSGPRSGGNYFAKFQRYWDSSFDRHNFSQLDLVAEQYLPYWNKTRVLALRFDASGTFAPEGNSVPFYLQPTLGGNERLRGFARYRFYDQNAMLATVEQRWHLFSGGHAALFFEAGKVASRASQLNFHHLEYSGGIGFRFTLHDAVIMRLDNAVSREGFRFMWTFSNPW